MGLVSRLTIWLYVLGLRIIIKSHKHKHEALKAYEMDDG